MNHSFILICNVYTECFLYPVDIMDTMEPHEEELETEIIYDNYSHDNVVTVSSSQVSNANETTNSEEEVKGSTYQIKNNTVRTVKKKGRPKGSLGQKDPNSVRTRRIKSVKTPQTPRPPKPMIVKTENLEPSRLPRMGLQLAQFKLPPEKIEEYQKSQQPFLQPGICFRIAPELDFCIECTKFSARRKNLNGDCRFYHFRKLK